MTNGQHVVDVAMSRLGERETNGPNRSPFIDMLNARWGLRGTPWCGAFWDWCYAEAGVDDSGLGHPSTQVMCDRARTQNAVWNGTHPIPPGAAWIRCGIHVAMVTQDRGDGTVSTVEGNHNDSVSIGRRNITDGLIVVPPAIRLPDEPPEPAKEYWLEDTHAAPKLFGPWARKADRDRELARIPQGRRSRARLVRGRAGGYGWIEGPRRMFGPWNDQHGRDAVRSSLERRLGHELRPFSRAA